MSIEDHDVVEMRREQPFIVIDSEVLKECRKRGKATPDMLLTYFVLQEMDSTGEWQSSGQSEKRLSELSGLNLKTVETNLNEFDSIQGVFQ